MSLSSHLEASLAALRGRSDALVEFAIAELLEKSEISMRVAALDELLHVESVESDRLAEAIAGEASVQLVINWWPLIEKLPRNKDLEADLDHMLNEAWGEVESGDATPDWLREVVDVITDRFAPVDELPTVEASLRSTIEAEISTNDAARKFANGVVASAAIIPLSAPLRTWWLATITTTLSTAQPVEEGVTDQILPHIVRAARQLSGTYTIEEATSLRTAAETRPTSVSCKGLVVEAYLAGAKTPKLPASAVASLYRRNRPADLNSLTSRWIEAEITTPDELSEIVDAISGDDEADQIAAACKQALGRMSIKDREKALCALIDTSRTRPWIASILGDFPTEATKVLRSFYASGRTAAAKARMVSVLPHLELSDEQRRDLLEHVLIQFAKTGNTGFDAAMRLIPSWCTPVPDGLASPLKGIKRNQQGERKKKIDEFLIGAGLIPKPAVSTLAKLGRKKKKRR